MTRRKKRAPAPPAALTDIARPRKPRAKTRKVKPLAPKESAALRAELAKAVAAEDAPRWNADPEEVQRSVARLVLTLVEFLRKLMERQAIRRMENGTIDAKETEQIGLALMKLEETVRAMAERFGVSPDELNLDLGPLGRLM